jgi:hypothetical protein
MLTNQDGAIGRADESVAAAPELDQIDEFTE